MKYLQCCLNWKVLVGVGVAALALWATAPNVVGAALPLLVALICPLSMIVMMVGMGRMRVGQRTFTTELTQPASRQERLAELRRQQQELDRQLNDVASELKSGRSVVTAQPGPNGHATPGALIR